MTLTDLVTQPLLAVFPHGLQHGSRRNARQATGLAAVGRRDRQAAEAFVREATARPPALVAPPAADAR